MEEFTRQKLHISVRNLVEFIFREGDIDNRYARGSSTETVFEGTRIHKKIQASQGVGYQAEVPLSISIEEDLYQLTIDGRADGIFTQKLERPEVLDEHGKVHIFVGEGTPTTCLTWIEEIKGVYQNVKSMEEPMHVHLAQAKCYAYIFAKQNELQAIGVQITYCNIDTEDIVQFQKAYSFDELEKWFQNLCWEYHKWAKFQCEWHMLRQASIKLLEFPFTYREGQRKLVGDVYRSILRQKMLFIQAPTGVGKTISTVFPAVKAVGENLADRIFYLTAKTITGTVARETFEILAEHGYRGKTILLTAKEKLCLCEEMECNPINCPYAKGHFEEVNDAVFEALHERDLFTREYVLELGKKHMVCPFEMSLDISNWCDNIICDYNYAFDPNVKLKRFFQEADKGDYILLIDEAHNLVDRSREMYSAQVYKEDFLAIKRLMKIQNKNIELLLEKCNRILLKYKRECEKYTIYDEIDTFLSSLQHLASEMSKFLEKAGNFAGRKDVLEFYLNLRNFLKISELTDNHYVIYGEVQEDRRFMLKLFCVDPSLNLQTCFDKVKSAVLFSATLLPIYYYKKLLSTREDNYAIYAESVFSQDQHLLMFGRDVSTKYTRRCRQEYERIASYIQAMVQAKPGNYMAFFPSYKLMQDVYEVFCEKMKNGVRFGVNDVPGNEDRYGVNTWDLKIVDIRENILEESRAEENRGDFSEQQSMFALSEETKQEELMLDDDAWIEGKTGNKKRVRSMIKCICQYSGMGERAREVFLEEFERTQEGETLIAFCVMGGIFGEGIDLKNDCLIGAAVIGTGLPKMSNEREILKNYYDEHGFNGFDYAFRYPGMNKVLQAAGRVIRTENDRGVILLLDERFLQGDYQELYPKEWEKRMVVSQGQVQAAIREFWK